MIGKPENLFSEICQQDFFENLYLSLFQYQKNSTVGVFWVINIDSLRYMGVFIRDCHLIH